MKVLLDTCAFIWLCCEPDRFTPAVRQLFLKEPDAELYLSDASVFEIALKSSMGKIELPESSREWVRKQTEIWKIRALPLSREEMFISAELPWHHKDPFDRLVIATAKHHQMPVITADRIFANYGVELIW
ncbi:MAG: type II toxin-antitoxin system VapC family toxin [bacterium]